MHPNIASMFDDAENRYLSPDELAPLNQYVASLPARLATYRAIRDQEQPLMQAVADQLESQFSQEDTIMLERCLKQALLILRYAAMGMLLNDEAFLQQRLIHWLEGTAKAYQTENIDAVLYGLLHQQLAHTLAPAQVQLLTPHIQIAEGVLVGSRQAHAIA